MSKWERSTSVNFLEASYGFCTQDYGYMDLSFLTWKVILLMRRYILFVVIFNSVLLLNELFLL